MVLGISADSSAKQKKFKDKYHLPFPLLARLPVSAERPTEDRYYLEPLARPDHR